MKLIGGILSAVKSVITFCSALLLAEILHNLASAYLEGKTISKSESCVVSLPTYFRYMLYQPHSKCNDICGGLTEIPRVSKISQDRFWTDFVELQRPIIITDAAGNWSATKVFGVDYFESLFLNGNGQRCQFFPYKTNFTSVEDFFRNIGAGNELSKGAKPWYVGWSNCDSQTSLKLRSHYDRPYFLPDDSSMSKDDWIFIGMPGYGAPMHLDRVRYPSWQFQVKGRKKWILRPPLDCFYHCLVQKFEVVLEPGEITIKLHNNTGVRYYSKAKSTPKILVPEIGRFP